MDRNHVLPQVQFSAEPNALRRVDFCAPQSYRGAGFLSISDLPRVAEEVSTVQTGELALKGRLHLTCHRCLQGCAVDLDEKRRFIFLATESQADDYPLEDEEQEPLVASQQFNLLETIEDEILLSIPLIPKHPEGFCEPHASVFGEGDGDEALAERENPFNVLKNMKKN
jgi:uncharacterized protein